jgi:thioester reductase-like protein
MGRGAARHGRSARGLDTRIYRPAFITASAAPLHREDVLVRVFSYAIRHRLSVDANRLSVVSVQVCAQNLIALAGLRIGTQVFHLTADSYWTMQMACQCITERALRVPVRRNRCDGESYETVLRPGRYPVPARCVHAE